MTIGKIFRGAVLLLLLGIVLAFLTAGIGYTMRGTPNPWSNAAEFALTMGYGGVEMQEGAIVLRYAAIASLALCLLAGVVIELCIFAFVLLLLGRAWRSLTQARRIPG